MVVADYLFNYMGTEPHSFKLIGLRPLVVLPVVDVGSVGLLNVRLLHRQTLAIDPQTSLGRFGFHWQLLRSSGRPAPGSSTRQVFTASPPAGLTRGSTDSSAAVGSAFDSVDLTAALEALRKPKVPESNCFRRHMSWLKMKLTPVP
jgi:hypothetical protein